MIAETASPASSIDANAARCVVTASGVRRTLSVISVAMPSVPSEPMNAPRRSGPSGSRALPPSSTMLPVGKHHLQPCHVVDGEAVLEAVRSTRVLRNVAADRAHLLARRVGCIEEAVGRNGLAHLKVRDPWLDDHPPRGEIDLEDPVHPGERDDDPIRDRESAAREPGTGATSDERHSLSGTDTDASSARRSSSLRGRRARAWHASP